MNTTQRLTAAISAAEKAGATLAANAQAIEKLQASIDAAITERGDVDSIVNAQAAAYEAWARGEGDEPELDSEGLAKARAQLAAAEGKAAAATTALLRIQATDTEALAAKETALAAIQPLAIMAVLEESIPAALDDVDKARSHIISASTRCDVATELLLDVAESVEHLPIGKELFDLNEKISRLIKRTTSIPRSITPPARLCALNGRPWLMSPQSPLAKNWITNNMPKYVTDETALEKALRLLDEIEASEGGAIAKGSDDPVARVNAVLDEIERMGDPEQVAKRAREDALAKWKAEPMPPKTLGAGAALAMSKERIEKMAKANGYGMSEAEWKRGLA